MTREIKFRAWNIEPDKIREGVRYKQSWMEYFEQSWMEYFDMGCLPCTDDYVLMQYTGLKDKNGKEIYEGDVVNEYDSDGDLIDTYEIIYEGNGFWPKGRDNEFGFSTDDDNFEIIGNKFENPELLTQKLGE